MTIERPIKTLRLPIESNDSFIDLTIFIDVSMFGNLFNSLRDLFFLTMIFMFCIEHFFNGIGWRFFARKLRLKFVFFRKKKKHRKTKKICLFFYIHGNLHFVVGQWSEREWMCACVCVCDSTNRPNENRYYRVIQSKIIHI